MKNLKLPTEKRNAIGKSVNRKPKSAIDDLVVELKSNKKLFFKLSTDPASIINEFDGLSENQLKLLEIINPADLINVGLKTPGSVQACGGSCGASCGGSCAGSCGASCGGSCGGSCGASCVGSCVGSCAGSCAGSCGASGALIAQDDWLENIDQMGDFKTNIELIQGIDKEIAQFSSFLRS